LIHEYVANLSVPFVTPPYVAILFSPLAHLPFTLAYLIWILVSIALYLGALTLLLRVEPLPPRMTLLICLAFPPFFMLVLAGGQISAIGCFILALWLYLMRTNRELLAGAALGLLLYKPTLVIFLLPALLFARKLRTLIGFAIVSAFLIMLSIWMVGPAGLVHYVAVLREFSALVDLGYTPPTMYVDLATFLRQLFHVNVKYITILLAVPLTYLTRNNPERAIVPTMVLNSYAPVYDLILLVPVLIVAYRFVSRKLLAVLFVVSFFTVPICQLTGLQIITPVLLVLCYVLCVKHQVQFAPLRLRETLST
ncbi:MAG TPA: glycosyltransferase family 87 protein, partial [Pyrinomonadaceae bacterium]